MTFFADYDGDGFLDLCEVKVKGNNLEWSWFIKAHQGDFKKSVTTVLVLLKSSALLVTLMEMVKQILL